MTKPVDPRHLLLIGAGPRVGASVIRRFGREGFRGTLIARGGGLEQLGTELRDDGLGIETVSVDIGDLDAYRATLEQIFQAPGAHDRPRRSRGPAAAARSRRGQAGHSHLGAAGKWEDLVAPRVG